MKDLLKNKTIIISGASGDIGFETSKLAINQGANLILITHKSYKKLNDYFFHYGDRVKIFSCDGTNEIEVKNIFEEIKNMNIKIDGLFNNIGDLLKREHFHNSNWGLYEESININFKSAYLFTKNSLELFNKNASIVMMSSMTARGGNGDRSVHYGISKSAMIGFSKTLSNELAKKFGIRVNSIAPGYIKGSFHDKYTLKDIEIEHAENNPLGRVGVASDVAGVVCFLLSDLSSYVNGTTIDINGGSYIN